MTRPPAITPLLKSWMFLVPGLAMAGVIAGAGVLAMRGPATMKELPFEMVAVDVEPGKTVLVQTREVTVQQWNECNAAGACRLKIHERDPGVDYPATGLSYIDAMEYIDWINARTGRNFRLPTSDEWYAIAIDVLPPTPDPIFTDPDLSWASAYMTEANTTGRALRPSGHFSSTSSGIVDLDGNVWEWTQDCYNDAGPDQCAAFIMGGEHKSVMSYLVRDPARGGCAVGAPPAHLGIRLFTDIPAGQKTPIAESTGNKYVSGLIPIN